MTEPLNELWKIEIEGNFEQKLAAIQKEIAASRVGWERLKSEFAGVAEFKRAASDMNKLKGAAKDTAKAWDAVLSDMTRVADEAGTLGNAYSSLAKETNKLNTARTKEAIILRQTKENQDPLLINLRAETAALRRLTGVLQDEQEKRRLAALAKEAGIKLSADGKRVFDAEAVALERIAKASEKAAVAEELRKRGFTDTGAPLPVPEVPKTPQQKAETKVGKDLETLNQKNLETQLKLNNKEYIAATKLSRELRDKMRELTEGVAKADGVFSQFAFTFRRLVGVMAVFTVARVVMREFGNMVKGAIRFQAEIESTRVGIAGLVAASAEIRSPGGNALGIDEQLLRSQQIAIDQMNKLRVDALATAASYNEIAAAFQNAVAPGLQANLTLDQIRKVTVNISQAATGLGLAQDQLAEEIRSLFTGAISARNTRVATALGITPADIARAKQAGKLFEFLDQRFAAIAKTGKLLMNTFTGQLSNAADAFKQLLATSSTPLFEQLKGALQDLQKGIFTTINDSVKLDPQTTNAFRELFQGLAQGIAAVRAAFSRLDFGGLTDALGLVGQVLATAAGALANAFVAFTNAAAPVLTTFRLLFSVVNSVLSIVSRLPEPIRAVLGFVTGLGLKGLFFVFTLKKVLPILASMAGWWGKIKNYMLASVAISTSMSSPLKSVNGVLQFIVINFKSIIKFATPVLAIMTGLDAVLKAFGVKKGVFENITDFVSGVGNKVFETLTGVKELKEELSGDAKSPFGIPVNDFRQLRGELTEVGIEIQNGIRAAAQELKRSVQTIGLPNAISSQITKSLQTEDNITNNKAYLQAERAVNQLEEQIRTLTEKAKEVSRTSLETQLNDLETRSRNLETSLYESSERLKKTFKGNFDNQLKFLSRVSEIERTQGRKTENLSGESRNFVDLKNALVEVRSEAKKVSAEFGTFFTPIDIANSQIDGLKNNLQQLRDAAKIQSLVEESAASFSDTFDTSLRAALLQSEIAEAAARAEAVGGLSVLAAEAAQKRAAAERLATAAIQQRVEAERGIAALRARVDQSFEILTNTDNPQLAEAADKQIVALQAQITAREKELALAKALGDEQIRLAAREARLAELRAKGSGGEGILAGLQQFATENQSLFDIGSQFAKGALDGFANLGGQAIGALFDPNSNFDLRDASAQLALQLGTDLATQLFKNLLAQSISGLGIDLGFDAAANAATLAAAKLQKDAAEKMGAAGVAWAPIAAALKAAADSLIEAAVPQAVNTATQVLGTATNARGGRVGMHTPRVRSNLTHHRSAPGFARGGYLGKDSRDTIPAWLRPGEWVIRPEAVGMYGDRLFHLLNRMQLNPAALSGIAATARAAGSVPRTAGRRIGYASGGRVASGRPSAPAAPVIVANYYDEQTMERSLAAGGQAQIRFARSKRSQMLASLGLTPGG